MMINEDIVDAMIRIAKSARLHAYVPYSNCAIGACALTSDGTLYGGATVENASYGLSCCAERVAIYKAISDSKRRFDALAVVADTEDPYSPCGACCQVMVEFDIPEVILANLKGDIRVLMLEDLAPCAMRTKKNKKAEDKEEEKEKEDKEEE
jgi:cytidine deaminase